MKKKAKRNKKYNPRKYLDLVVRDKVKNFAIAMVLGETKYCTLIDYKTGEELNVTVDVAESVEKGCFNWYYECSVVCRDQNGKEYVVSEPHYFQSRYRQSDERLNKYLNEVHVAFKENKTHFILSRWPGSLFQLWMKRKTLTSRPLARFTKTLVRSITYQRGRTNSLRRRKWRDQIQIS